MKSGLLLDVVVRERATIFQLLTSEDQALLVWGDALLVLDLGLHILNGWLLNTSPSPRDGLLARMAAGA